MPIDPNISLAVKPVELADPLAQYGKVAAIQSAQNQNQLAQFQLGAAQRAEEDVQTMRNALSGVKFGTPEYESAITGAYAKTGNVKGLQEYQKTKAEAEKNAVELKIKQDEMHRAMLGNLAMNPSDQNIQAHLQDLLIQRSITPEQAQQRWQQVAGMNLAQRAKYFNDAAQTAHQRVLAEQGQQRIGLEGQRVGLESQRVGLENRRVGLAEEEAKLKREGIEGIAPKELQKREAALPAATQSIKGFEAKSENFIKDLKNLRDHPGLDSITGLVYGRTPSVTAEGRAAQALYDKVVAKGGFQALQDLRDASKTGGALGNVSNQEGKQLTSSFAAIDRKQDASDVRAAIDQAIADIEGARTRTREAYDATYAYKAKKPAIGGGEVDTSNPLLGGKP